MNLRDLKRMNHKIKLSPFRRKSQDLQLSNKFDGQVQFILHKMLNPYGDHILINNFLNFKDCEENADYSLKFVNDIKSERKIACRIRRFQENKYFDNITIRCKTKSGKECEWDKFLNSEGDLMFYGILNTQETKIIYARLINLNILRRFNSEYKVPKKDYLGYVKNNNDGTAFRAINLSELPRQLNNHNLIIGEFGDKKITHNDISFDNWLNNLKPLISWNDDKQQIPELSLV
jgi:hypothetical protein